MANNLKVSISADVTDLQTKFGVARAETQALQTEFNSLARASAAGPLDANAQARFQQLAGDLLAARTQAAGYAKDLRDAGFAASGFGTAAVRAAEGAEGLGLNTASAVRYTRELFDEISSGRTRYLPSTLAALANQGLHLSPAMMAAAGGVAALAAGLGYLIYRTVAASNALDRLDLASLRAGNEFTRVQFEALNEQLEQLPNVSSSAAAAITTALGSVHAPFEALQAAARIAAEQMAQTGQSGQEAAEDIAKALDVSMTATELAKRYQDDLTQAQVDAAIAADKSGNANAILAEKLQLLSAPLGRARTDVREYTRSWGQAFYEAGAEIGLANEGIDGQTTVLGENKAAWAANAAEIARYTAALQALPADKTLSFKAQSGSGEDQALAAAQQAADVKQQISEREIEQAQQALNQIAAAQEQATAEALSAAQQAADTKLAITEREIKQEQADLQKLADAQKAAAARRAADEKEAVRSIESAEDTMISGLLSRRESFSEAARQMAAKLAEKEIEAAAHSVTERLLSEQVLQLKDKALQEAGYLYHQLFESQKTAGTIAQQAAQTSATTAGNASRTASNAAAQVAAHAQSAATGPPLIMADAARAFAGTYASVAQIPYVGWIMAPGAAAAAQATVMSQVGMASLDTGTNYVPRDMLAQIHEGEAVVPREYNPAAGGSGVGASSEEHHYNGTWNVSMSDTNMRRLLSSRSGQRQVMKALTGAWRRGARP